MSTASTSRTLLKFILPPAVLLGGLMLTGGLVALSGAAETAPPTESVTPVDVIEAALDTGPATILATGTVSASQEVVITPEVAGKLRWVSDKLVPGGRFAAGEQLARIDAGNMVAAMEAAERGLRQAELDLALERSRGEVATREWSMLSEGDRAGRDPDLALRRPHLRLAEQALVAAQSGLDKARADVGRTRLTAPFNAVVVNENVDVGQVVGASTQVASLVGTDSTRVTVSLPVERIAVLDVPGLPRADGLVPERGSEARVSQVLGDGSSITRTGRVLALGGTLDGQTRNAQVIVEIPADLESQTGLPLMPGAFVSVELMGRGLDRAFRVPRVAVRDGDTVWVVDDEDRLARLTVGVGWSLPEEVMVVSGIDDGQRIVVSALSNPLAGQRVNPRPASR